MFCELQTLHCPGGNFNSQKHSCPGRHTLSPVRYLLYARESSLMNFSRRSPKRKDKKKKIARRVLHLFFQNSKKKFPMWNYLANCLHSILFVRKALLLKEGKFKLDIRKELCPVWMWGSVAWGALGWRLSGFKDSQFLLLAYPSCYLAREGLCLWRPSAPPLLQLIPLPLKGKANTAKQQKAANSP